MSSDYTMPCVDTEFTISIDIPNTLSPAQELRASYTLPGSASKGFRCYMTSTAFDYAVVGCFGGEIGYNSNQAIVYKIARDQDKYELIVWSPFALQSISGQAQTLTAHIQTFLDPFNPEL